MTSQPALNRGLRNPSKREGIPARDVGVVNLVHAIDVESGYSPSDPISSCLRTLLRRPTLPAFQPAQRKSYFAIDVSVCGANPSSLRGSSSLLPIWLKRRLAAADARGRPPTQPQSGCGRTAAGVHHSQCDASLSWLMTKM